MPKETIVITSESDIYLMDNQMVIKIADDNLQYSRAIEDIHLVMIDHHSVHLTVPLINRLSENNIAVVFCNEKHIPTAMIMDLESNKLQNKYFRFQLEASKPLKKQLWKRIIEAKIINQNNLLNHLGIESDALKEYYLNYINTTSSLSKIYVGDENELWYPIL